MARRTTTSLGADPVVTLFKAVRPGTGGADLGALFVKRGLDPTDDPDGYRPTPPGMPVSLAGGAYFTTNESYAVRLAANKRYRRGIVVAVLPARDFTRLEATDGILLDRYVQASYRVQPAAFTDFNRFTSSPVGSRSLHLPGSSLPSGLAVP